MRRFVGFIKALVFPHLRANLSEMHLFQVMNTYYWLARRGRVKLSRTESGMYRLMDSSGRTIYIAQFFRFPMYTQGVAQRVAYLADSYYLSSLEIEPPGLLIDCGANIGELGIWAACRGLQYLAFEPEPLEGMCAEANTELPIDRRALWNKTSRLTFYSKPASADSSLIDPGGADRTFKIEAVRLDEVVNAELLKHIRGVVILKVEAEGGEPEVLEGATDILPFVDYVTVDCGPERGILHESTYEQVSRILADQNFTILRINHEQSRALFKRGCRPGTVPRPQYQAARS